MPGFPFPSCWPSPVVLGVDGSPFQNGWNTPASGQRSCTALVGACEVGSAERGRGPGKMAVDYFHRVIVTGQQRKVQELRRALVRKWSRKVGGETFTERLPFSIASLYAIAPGARRIEPEIPGEAYDVSVWPLVRRTRTRVEIRYQLHTRDFDVVGLLRALSRVFPTLTFRLSTLCLDDSDVDGYAIIDGRVRRWNVPEHRRDVHWERARQKFNLAGDAVFDDEAATLFAEDGMQDEALDHWDPEPGRRAHRPRAWWNRPAARDFMLEREIDLVAISEMLSAEPPASKPKRSRKRKAARATTRQRTR